MSCPRCQMPIDNPDESVCPHCGYVLPPPMQPSPTGAPTPHGPQTTDTPFTPSPYLAPVPPPMPMGPFLGNGAPPNDSLYSPDMPPYPHYPPYSAYPPYGTPAPGTAPLAPYPTRVPAPPAPPRRTSVLVRVITLLTVAFVIVSGTAVYLAIGRQSGPSAHAPFATATPSYAVLFQDPMTSNVNGWPNVSSCHFASDGYHVTDRICYAPASGVSDFDLTVSARQIKGPTTIDYGVVFRRTDIDNFYAFQIDSSGWWRVLLVASNVASYLISETSNAAIHHGLNVTNVLEVRATGTHFAFYVNATYVGQMSNSAYASGDCGVEAQQYAEVVFTNLTISTPIL